MVFKSGVGKRTGANVMIIPHYKYKGERTECKNLKGNSLIKIILKLVPDWQLPVTEGLIYYEQEGFKSVRKCVSNLYSEANL